MTSPTYFEQLYADSVDPWQLAERAYERRKYAVTIASLPLERYARGFEPGCSIGVLTRQLATRCDELLASDPVEAPLRVARRSVTGDHVTFDVASIPRDWPDGSFDLIVLSELLYFLSVDDRFDVMERTIDSLSAEGHLVLVHWRHPFEAAVCTGDDVHREASARAGLRTIVEHVEDDFRLTVLAHA